MARKSKSGVNVSEAIRKYLKANKGVGPTAAAKAISEKIGQKVSPTYVSNIKSTIGGSKKGRKGRKPGPKPGRAIFTARAHSNGSVQLATIEAMKTIVGQVGVDTARQLIDLLA